MKAGDHTPTPTRGELAGRLVDLARSATTNPLTLDEQAGLQRLEQALLRSPPKLLWSLPRVLAPAAVLAALGGVAAAYGLRERAITFEVISGRVSDGGYVASGSGDADVRFSDQSDIGLDPATRLRISDLEVRGARVMLEGGTLHARIHTRPRGHWTLDAGPYIVRVTGTEFDLAWRVDEQTLDLRLHKGAVIVEGPLAGSGVMVAAGQHLIANASAGTLSLDEFGADSAGPAAQSSTASPAAAAPLAVIAATAAPDPPRPPTAALKTGPTAGRGRGDEAAWGTRVAHGDFDGVLEDAERRGMDRAMVECSSADLAALADAARYARRPEIALRALTAQRKRFAGSVRARDASFFLAGLAEAQKSDATSLEWYGVYLGESPAGAYAPQALGHKMMLLQKLKGAAEARPVAIEYLARFADGPYAPQARKLLDGP